MSSSCQKLQFTEADCSSHEAALATTALSLVVLNQQLERLLLEDMASDEQIFDWVEVRTVTLKAHHTTQHSHVWLCHTHIGL